MLLLAVQLGTFVPTLYPMMLQSYPAESDCRDSTDFQMEQETVAVSRRALFLNFTFHFI